MHKYNFIAKDKDGNVVKDSLQAKSRYEAVELLQKRDLTVVSLSSSPLDRFKKEEPSTAEKRRKTLFSSLSRVGLREFSVFCRQLSICIASGINLVDALQSIAEDMENPYFRDMLFRVNRDIKNGESFSGAIAKYKKVFSPLFVNLMKAAEESGSLRVVLNYLSLYLEKNVQLERKVRSITVYPLFVAIFFIIVVIVFTVSILPRFESMFSSFNAELPQITQMVFSVNRFFIYNMPLLSLVFITAMVGFFLYGRTSTGRYNIDRFKLNLTLFGELLRKSSIARFSRILAVMIRGGVSIVSAISIASKSCANKVMEQSLEEAKLQIMDGYDIASSLEKDKNFTNLLVRMVGIGESSGRLPNTLDSIADMYEDEVEGEIMIITSLFEPIVIILFGGIILILVLAIYVPIFKIAMTMRGGG